jgi:Uma2 family endonuclease
MVTAKTLTSQLTLEEFLTQPETKPASEYFDHEITQKPMPQGEHSTLQGELVSAINHVGKPQELAYALPELRCTFSGTSTVPDVAVFTWNRIPRTDKGRVANKVTTHPDWIIEILSPDQSANKVIKKILFYIKQGTQLGWLIDPEDESVIIFKPSQLPEIKSDSDILTVLDVLKDWELSVTEMFAWLQID